MPSWPWATGRRIGWILPAAIPWLISGCLGLGASPFLPEIPARPIFTGPLELMECSYAGAPTKCVVALLEDWLKLRAYYLKLETELPAACLALGHGASACKADEPTRGRGDAGRRGGGEAEMGGEKKNGP